jgi:hypothetical protein
MLSVSEAAVALLVFVGILDNPAAMAVYVLWAEEAVGRSVITEALLAIAVSFAVYSQVADLAGSLETVAEWFVIILLAPLQVLTVQQKE